MRKGRDILHALKARRVLGVEAEAVGYELVAIIKMQILAFERRDVAVKVVERTADDGAETCIDVGFYICVIVEIHIKARGDAA